MKLFIFFCGLLCLQGSLGFFSVKVTKVMFEEDIKKLSTPIVMSAEALLKSLGDLLTAIDAQIVPASLLLAESVKETRQLRQEPPPPKPGPSATVLVNRNDVVILINYTKLINFVIGDILRLSADTMLTTARDFSVLIADIAAVNKFVMGSMPELAAKNIDDVFATKTMTTVTLLNSVFTSLATELPLLLTAVQKSQGKNPPNDGPKTDIGLDADIILKIKADITTLSTNLPILVTIFTDLTMTIVAENSIISTAATAVNMIPSTAAEVLATVTTAMQAANTAFQTPVTDTIGMIATEFATVTAKMEMMYTDTIIAPTIIPVEKAIEAYVTSVSKSLQSMSTGFATSTTSLLMSTEETMKSFALDLSAHIGTTGTSIEAFNLNIIEYLKKNTVAMRKCVMTFTPTVGAILTDVNKQFASCAAITSSFQDEEKYAETNLKVILNRSTAFATSLGECLTAVTTISSAKQINRCIGLVLADMMIDGGELPDGTAAKYSAGSVEVFKADLIDFKTIFKDCALVAYIVLDKSLTAWKTALTACT